MRRGIAEWLCGELERYIPIAVGIDHAFSSPVAYFDRRRLTARLAELLG